MNRILLFLLFFALQHNAFSQHCTAQQLLNQRIENNPEVLSNRTNLELGTKKWMNEHRQDNFRDVITIEVVVHVVWKEVAENISDEQILSQIEVLNEDYRLMNANANIITHPPFVALMADMELEFRLATTDPDGNASNGITRTQTNINNIASTNQVFYSAAGGQDAWCTQHYLNIWVANIGGGILGISSFPEDGTLAEEEGIRISSTAFGRMGAVEAPYHLGRTLTHEIGHYFNLLHLWGGGVDNFDCQGDDEVEDTPLQSRSYKETCFLNIHLSCGSVDMTANFLNYTDDACLAMFTEGQKMRALAALNLSRPGLLNAANCYVPIAEVKGLDTKVEISPNPATEWLDIQIDSRFESTFSLEILDINGRLLLKKADLKSGNNRLSLGNFKNGFYLVKISDGMRFVIKKIILLH